MKHEMAVSMIDSLKTLYTEHWQRTDDARAARELSVCFEHVTRENSNTFSLGVNRLNQTFFDFFYSISH